MSKDFIDKVKHLLSHGAINDPKQLDAIKGLNHSPIRLAVAKHPNTSQETLHYLAGDPNDSVRKEVVNNHNTHQQTLQWMSENDDHAYIKHVAKERLKPQ